MPPAGVRVVPEWEQRPPTDDRAAGGLDTRMEQDHRTSRTSRPAPPAGEARPPTLHDGPAVPVDADLTGTVLGGRYRLEEVIGAGAMGVVWTAWDRRLRRTVAVKQLAMVRDGQGDAVAARAARTRAMREGRIAARVVHPRAIAVFDAVDHDSMPWLVMEYLPSRSLAAVLADQGPLDPRAVAHIGAQIADALIAVHDAGIVHGDVKPGNVLLTDDGVAKLTDFGVSRASWDTSATGSGMVAGTPGYFAPEVARGVDPTPASDVFSLGATLYAAVENELVCGRLDNTLAGCTRWPRDGCAPPPGRACWSALSRRCCAPTPPPAPPPARCATCSPRAVAAPARSWPRR